MILSDLFIHKTSVDGVGSQGQRREISSLSFKECFLKRNIIYLSQERKTERKKEREGGRKETEVPVKKTVLVSVM